MSRQVLIALVASIAVVAIAFWGVTLLFPMPPSSADTIVGKWRIAKAADCSDSGGYMIVAPDAVTFFGKGLSAAPIVVTAIETDSNGGHHLRAYLKGGLQEVDFLITYKIDGDALTFQSSDWSPEARAKYPSQIAQMDASPLSPGKMIAKILQVYQPYQRCPE